MNMSLIQLREEQVEAHSAFEAATQAIKDADLGADLDTLEASFKEAEERYTNACKEYEAEVDRQNRARQKFELDQQAIDADKRLSGTPTVKADVRVSKEPLTYRRGGEHSFFTDLARRDIHHDMAAAERLARHMKEVQVERAAKFDLNSTDGSGGYLVAPIYLQDEFADMARAGRVTANVIGSRPLPPKTDSITIPKLTSGVTTAAQTDGGAVSETDLVDTTTSAAVLTVAGMQDVSQQVVDRSVPGIDDIVFGDLVKHYNLTLDTAVLNSTTTNSKGLLQATGTNSVTWTTSTPTLPGLYPKIADAINQVHTGVFMSPDAIIMHPRRWAFCLASLDSSNRPLIVPAANNPQNAAGTFGGDAAEGFVGTMQGINVYVDANIPATTGAGTNQDSVIVLRRSESYLWEDPTGPHLDTFRDVGSGTLTVRYRLFNYYAQAHERRPASISKVTGTGLVSPSF